MTKNYLFFADQGMVTILSMSFKGRREFYMEFLKRLGENTFPIPENFWDWWKKSVSYTIEDTVDFCFIYDEEYPFLKDSFIEQADKPEQTIWDMDYLTSFFKEFSGYSNVCLTTGNGVEVTLSFTGRRTDRKNGTFATNICGEVGETAAAMEPEDSMETEDCVESEASGVVERPRQGEKKVKRLESSKVSDFARYFMDLLEAERN